MEIAYMSKKQMSEYLGYSRPTINKLIEGINKEIPARYPRCAIAGKRINLFAVIDYMTYREWLADGRLRKQCPAFDPIAIARLCGQEGVMV